jgi:hypothetical protein
MAQIGWSLFKLVRLRMRPNLINCIITLIILDRIQEGVHSWPIAKSGMMQNHLPQCSDQHRLNHLPLKNKRELVDTAVPPPEPQELGPCHRLASTHSRWEETELWHLFWEVAKPQTVPKSAWEFNSLPHAKGFFIYLTRNLVCEGQWKTLTNAFLATFDPGLLSVHRTKGSLIQRNELVTDEPSLCPLNEMLFAVSCFHWTVSGSVVFIPGG